ncbi:L-threonine 3-dehydrogenase [Pseudothermotoga thermarum]|uniref:L-threonine 3-dehydrogenase n=1 Tax=Pseudothermotoga thermarum DSM 5069 TaxID=688269 RepID=F7YWN7_9THEM|nr:L-threonine 3-dehydrogenase [Pseudothermotoga thermarum]AEH52025.1 L-threonine 3-dehydrogenase [Pseudothermotoga thermarum DSM 5069]
MLAIRKTSMAAGLSMENVEQPKELAPNEVLVKVKKASICGSDVHIYKWDKWAQSHIRPPMTIGHEFAGVVEAVGEAVDTVKVGDYVAAESHIPCQNCYQCRTGRMHICKDMKILGVDIDGAFAQYIKVPQVILWKVSKEIPEEYASVMEPFGNAVHATLVEDLTGKTVLITGVGPIGAMAIQVAKAAGASLVIASEIREYRKQLAKINGADVVIDPSCQDLEKEVVKLTNGEGVDVVIEMSGNVQALLDGLKCVTRGGAVSILGVYSKNVEIPIDEFVTFKGLKVYGITGRKMFETWRTADQLLKSKKVDLSKVVTHVIPFQDWQKGFELMIKGDCGKIVMEIS